MAFYLKLEKILIHLYFQSMKVMSIDGFFLIFFCAEQSLAYRTNFP